MSLLLAAIPGWSLPPASFFDQLEEATPVFAEGRFSLRAARCNPPAAGLRPATAGATAAATSALFLATEAAIGAAMVASAHHRPHNRRPRPARHRPHAPTSTGLAASAHRPRTLQSWRRTRQTAGAASATPYAAGSPTSDPSPAARARAHHQRGDGPGGHVLRDAPPQPRNLWPSL